jgi:Transcriptional regulator/sugar kinase
MLPESIETCRSGGIRMQDMTGKPELMKKMNVTLIYRALIELRSATRAEISEKTNISITTVRALLEEMLKSGEIAELELDASSGGRRAQRYALNPKRNLVLSLYFEEQAIVYQITDLLGTVIESGLREAKGENVWELAAQFVAACMSKRKISAVGLGVPGIVEEGRFYVSSGFNLWSINNLGEQIQNRYRLPVILENDLNAIAFGFARHYAQTRPNCDLSAVNLAYIHFNRDCTGAGIIAGGKIVYGAKRFAGELGFLPFMPGKSLDAVLKETAAQKDYADIVGRLIAIVNCVTNPSIVVIGGNRQKTGWISLESVIKAAKTYVSDLMLPEIIFSDNYKADYLSGLANLTIQAVVPKLPLAPV